MEEPSAINYMNTHEFVIRMKYRWSSYSIDILSLELREELVQAIVVAVNANGGNDLLDVSGGGVCLATDLEEEVSSNVTHLELR